MLDAGCGNGKNLPAANEVGFGLGLDFSTSLVAICRTRGLEVGAADALALPVRSEVMEGGKPRPFRRHSNNPLTAL